MPFERLKKDFLLERIIIYVRKSTNLTSFVPPIVFFFYLYHSLSVIIYVNIVQYFQNLLRILKYKIKYVIIVQNCIKTNSSKSAKQKQTKIEL